MIGPRSLFRAARHLSRSDCDALARRVLAFATADETRVTITSGMQGNTRFALNQVSTAGDSYNAAVTVQSSFGRRTGSSTTNRLEDEALRAAVQTAERLARLSPEDPEALPLLGPHDYAESLGWSEATAALTTTVRTPDGTGSGWGGGSPTCMSRPGRRSAPGRSRRCGGTSC